MNMTEQQVTKTSSNLDDHATLKCLVLASVISADNDKYPEEVKQIVLDRLDKEDIYGSKISPKINWDYVFEPLGDDAKRLVDIMRS